MKKLMLTAMVLLTCGLFAACDLKTCYCHEITSSGDYKEEVYIDADSRCSSRNKGEQYVCLEESEERAMTGGGVAYAPAPNL